MRIHLLMTALVVLVGCEAPSSQVGEVEVAPLAGRVVTMSGEPVKGAVVVAAMPWFAVAGSNLHEGTYYEQHGDISIRNTVTDEQGRFVLLGERAKAPDDALVSNRGMQIGIFAPGYAFTWIDDSGSRIEESFRTVPARVTSMHDGKTIRLEAAEVQLSAHDSERIQAFIRGRGFVHLNDCRWQRMPALVKKLSEIATSQFIKGIESGCGTVPAASPENGGATPVIWEGQGSERELVVDLDRIDVEGTRSPPSPFTGVFDIKFVDAEPEAGDQILVENAMTGHRLVYGQPGPLVASVGDVFRIRVVRLSRLMKKPPEVDTGIDARAQAQ